MTPVPAPEPAGTLVVFGHLRSLTRISGPGKRAGALIDVHMVDVPCDHRCITNHVGVRVCAMVGEDRMVLR